MSKNKKKTVDELIALAAKRGKKVRQVILFGLRGEK